MEVDKLEVGRELDALIAEKVMGLDVLGWASGVCYGGDGWYIQDAEPKTHPAFLEHCFCDIGDYGDSWPVALGHDVGCLGVVRFYSTEIAAAWEVVEKLRGMGLNIRLHTWGEGWQFACGNVFTDWVIPDDAYWSTAKTIPHAICLSALRALGAESK